MESDNDFGYKPDMHVVRAARHLIGALCNAYGTDKGMALWDHIRAGLGEKIAADIFLGMITGTGELEVCNVGDRRIEAIREVRHLTKWGLKEAKDFVEKVAYDGPQRIPTEGMDERFVDEFVRNMNRIGCTVR